MESSRELREMPQKADSLSCPFRPLKLDSSSRWRSPAIAVRHRLSLSDSVCSLNVLTECLCSSPIGYTSRRLPARQTLDDFPKFDFISALIWRNRVRLNYSVRRPIVLACESQAVILSILSITKWASSRTVFRLVFRAVFSSFIESSPSLMHWPDADRT